MYSLWKIKNRTVVLAIALVLVFLVGVLDQVTSKEFSSTIFYLIPITLLALYRNTKVSAIIICAFVASLLWVYGETNSTKYTSLFYPTWNGFVKLTIFNTVGLLLYYLKEKQRKLSSVNKYLLASNEEKNTFVGIAAHDLRNPISGIYSLSDLLLTNNKDKLDPEMAEGLNYIKTLSNNTLTIIQDLLNVSRLESGKIELKIKSEDYISFIKQQITLNQLVARQKSIKIHFRTKGENLVADFDKNHMKEVIGNLLSNAIKYSNPNTEITVNTSLTADGNILTEVIDKGKGIPEEEQMKLFRYFQTASTQPTNGEQSTGLGLAIAKQIISLHNGKIGVKSAPGLGSTFYYTFPQHNDKLQQTK
jgi:signal transduction histidine kinase